MLHFLIWDFPLMPPLVCHAWFGAYSLNKKRPRGARSCILAHFQRVKFSFFRQIAHFLIILYWKIAFLPTRRLFMHFQTVKFSFFRQMLHFLIWDFPLMPPLVCHAWFGAYSLNKKRPRGARSCILAHFQRVKFSFFRQIAHFLIWDFPEMPPLVRHAWFGAYSLKQKRPRGARSCILAHFQRVKLFL